MNKNAEVISADYIISSHWDLAELKIDPELVDDWNIKWNELIVKFKDGTVKEFKPTDNAEHFNFKTPTSIFIDGEEEEI